MPATSRSTPACAQGQVFDETAIRFFIVFNTKLKLFHYILDETVKPADGARVAVTPYMK